MGYFNVACFTGHRPNKLNLSEAEVKALLNKAIDDAISKEITVFITGMAEGVDVWAAEIVLEKKKENEAVKLICALPHTGFEKRRSEEEKEKFNHILENADLVKLINDHYFTGCYQVRNKWMVDQSALLIAVFNGEKGGTKNTIDYAKKCGVPAVNVLEMI